MTSGAEGYQQALATRAGAGVGTGEGSVVGKSGADLMREVALKEANLNASTGATLSGADLEQARNDYIVANPEAAPE